MPHTIRGARGWEIDLRRETISWSARSARLIGFGAPGAGVPLAQFYSAVHSADRDAVQRGLMRGTARGRMRVVFRIVLPEGRIRRVVANGLLVADVADRAAMRMVGWFEPRRRRVGHSITTSAQRMALVAAAADVGFWRIDLETRARWLSPFALAIFGQGAEETQTTEMFYAAVHPDDRERVRAARAAAEAGRGRLDDMFRIVRRDGAVRWLHSVAVVMADRRSGHDHLIGVTADVTDRVLAQQELLEQQRQLAHLARVAVAGELSGAIAHEVSQPIAAILNNSRAAEQLLEQGPIDRAVFHEILEDIVDAGRRAGDVVQRVRDLIRNESITPEVLHLGCLVNDVLALLRSELRQHDVEVQVDVDPALPPVFGDRVQLQQVVVNLILNACDAMSDTKPCDRHIVIIGVGHEHGSCELIVADRGPGIPLGQIEHIFEPFVTSKAHGVGLGLALSRKLVAMHGGRIWAENDRAGAAFHVSLPGITESTIRPISIQRG